MKRRITQLIRSHWLFAVPLGVQDTTNSTTFHRLIGTIADTNAVTIVGAIVKGPNELRSTQGRTRTDRPVALIFSPYASTQEAGSDDSRSAPGCIEGRAMP